MKFFRKLFRNNNTQKRLGELSDRLELLSCVNLKLENVNSKLEKDVHSLREEMWSFKRDVNSDVSNLEGKFGWRKVSKKLSGWKNEQELIELYAHVYVLDDGYRKLLKPFLISDIKGNIELLHKEYKKTWSGEYKLKCYMVTRLVLPGYYKLDDFLTNNSDNFTMVKMFGKSYKELVAYMMEYNYQRTSGDIYSIDFYEL